MIKTLFTYNNYNKIIIIIKRAVETVPNGR